ncbi:MAG: YbaB/EbfC family nucleoid-associated protein [Ruminococcaceae bacterium]|nr:YbaB/EbfC family nucleoid-associated protein [Oscillospiraceae bacterium]
MKVRLPNNGGGNMNQMLKQAQKMQEDMQNLQADLEQREFTATSGGGLVEVTVDGKHLIKSIKISPDAVDPDDSEMLEDLVTVAVNEAISNAIKTSEEEMGAITGGLNLPGMF